MLQSLTPFHLCCIFWYPSNLSHGERELHLLLLCTNCSLTSWYQVQGISIRKKPQVKLSELPPGLRSSHQLGQQWLDIRLLLVSFLHHIKATCLYKREKWHLIKHLQYFFSCFFSWEKWDVGESATEKYHTDKCISSPMQFRSTQSWCQVAKSPGTKSCIEPLRVPPPDDMRISLVVMFQRWSQAQGQPIYEVMLAQAADRYGLPVSVHLLAHTCIFCFSFHSLEKRRQR